MSSVYDLKVSGDLGRPTLPKATDPLRDQRAAVRALRILYPGVSAKLFSVRVQDGKRVVRELEI